MTKTPTYKRGTFTKNGKTYGYYPDGSVYRIYAGSDIPFLQIVDADGNTFLRVRHQLSNVGIAPCANRRRWQTGKCFDLRAAAGGVCRTIKQSI